MGDRVAEDDGGFPKGVWDIREVSVYGACDGDLIEPGPKRHTLSKEVQIFDPAAGDLTCGEWDAGVGSA